jgi:pyruvate dehydrogenase E2 component (dihydrolipoamide acetyltransferase)
MAEAIRMPLLSDTMKEGIIAAWHKKVGDQVKADDVLADVETDKATMEVMGYVDGTLLYIGVEKGKAAKVNDIIAIVGKQGEDYKNLLNEKPPEKGPKQDTAPKDAPPTPADSSAIPPEKPQTPKEDPKDMTVVRMPLLSDTMKEGKMVEWHKKVGDEVKSDDILADVETDKATMEVMGYADGVLLYIGVEKGKVAKVNDIIAIIGKAGANFQSVLDGQQTAPGPAISGAPDPMPAPKAGEPAPPAESNTTSPSPDGRVKASPLARKMAKEKGIDISQVEGSGDEGRIIKRDVDHFTPAASGNIPATGTAAHWGTGEESHQDVPVSQMRKTIARRLGESMFSAPHFYLTIEVNMDAAFEGRKAINELSEVKVSFNDLVIKAAASALQRHPQVNSSWMGDFIRQYGHIHIGSAVAMEEGLIVPVIRFANQKSLVQIATEARQLYEKVRNRKIQPQDFTGNTFTVSNLGMLDIDEFTAIINPPDSCILAVGRIKETPIADNGLVRIARIMKLTLSCDHRIVDGATGARFLQSLKGFLENPVTMLA